MLKGMVKIHRWGRSRRPGEAEPAWPGETPVPGGEATEEALLEDSVAPLELPEGADPTISRVRAWLSVAQQGSLDADADGAHLDWGVAGGSARRAELTAVCSPFHSTESGAPALYHISTKCSEGQRIRADHVAEGVGGDSSLCDECVSVTLGSWASPSGDSWYGPTRA